MNITPFFSERGRIFLILNDTENTFEQTISRMREAMRKIMSESYIQGSNDNYNAMMVKYDKR